MKAGNLVKLSPGNYLRAVVSIEHPAPPFLNLEHETNAVIVDFQGKDNQKNLSCWSALVNNDLLIVWQDQLIQISPDS